MTVNLFTPFELFFNISMFVCYAALWLLLAFLVVLLS
jgi:hypothetical protein